MVSKNVIETIKFLTCCRKELAENSPSKANFYLKEATDYQILSMIFEDRLPSEKNDPILESAYIVKANMGLSELLDNVNLEKDGFVPLCEFGLTSNPVVLKYLVENDIVSEAFPGYEKTKGFIKDVKRSKAMYDALGRIPWLGPKIQKDFRKTGEAILGVTALMGLAGYLMGKAIEKDFSKAKVICSKFEGEERKACYRKFKIDSYKTQISLLQKLKSNCSKSNDPKKCSAKLDAKISKIKAKMVKA